jgi:xanthine dehydrogenase accessory factor
VRDLLETIDAWQAEGLGFGRAIVVRTYGSAPRREGATLLRGDDGRMAGSVSGGCVEGAASMEIERARDTGRVRFVRYGISDEQAWGVGLTCGGTVDLLVEPLVAEEALAAARAVAGGRTGARAVLTPLPLGAPGAGSEAQPPADGEPPSRRMVVHDDGRIEGSLGAADLDRRLAEEARAALRRGVSHMSATTLTDGRQVFIEAFPVAPRLVIVGAEQVAMSLVRFARELGYRSVVIDGRAAFATRERFPAVDELIAGWPDEVAEDIALGPADAVAILSHDPRFDVPALLEALRRGCRYVGLIGSRKTQGDRRARLRELGVAEADLARIRGPIGLDLGGRATAETALAIMSEVVAERHGASGLAMSERVIDDTADKERRGVR